MAVLTVRDIETNLIEVHWTEQYSVQKAWKTSCSMEILWNISHGIPWSLHWKLRIFWPTWIPWSMKLKPLFPCKFHGNSVESHAVMITEFSCFCPRAITMNNVFHENFMEYFIWYSTEYPWKTSYMFRSIWNSMKYKTATCILQDRRIYSILYCRLIVKSAS